MPMAVYVKVRNPDITSHSFDVAAYANSTLIGTHAVTLNSGEETIVTFSWSTVAFPEYSNYTFSASIEGVSGNKFSSSEKAVMVVHMGDITGDRRVDTADLARVSGAFGSVRINNPLDGRYGQYWHIPTPCVTCPHQPNTDVNGNRAVDATGDLARTSANFGWHL